MERAQREEKRGKTAAAKGLRQSLAVLRHRDYRLFWIGMTVSMVGTWMQQMALSWVVVARLTTSPAALGAINFAGALPMLLLSLLGGVAADRGDKRRILFITQGTMMLLAFVFAAMVAGGHLKLWHVLVLSALGGLAAAYDMPAFQAYYPTLVEREELPQVIALNQASFHGSRMIGPALAGLAIGWWGVPSAFIANGLSFLGVIAALLLIRARPAATDLASGSTFSAVGEGLRFVWGDVCLRSLVGLTALTTLLVFPNAAVLIPIYARNVLGVGPQGLGLLMSLSGLGALIGAVGLLALASHAATRRIALGVGATYAGLAVLGYSRHLWLSSAAMLIQSLGLATTMGLVSTIIQQTVPDALRGRVMSVHGMAFVGIMPFSALLVPGAAEWLGLVAELRIAAVLYAVAGAFLLRRLWAGTVGGAAVETHEPVEAAH